LKHILKERNQLTFWEDKGGFEGFKEGDVTHLKKKNPISNFYVFLFFLFPSSFLFVFFFYGLIL